MPQRSTPRRRSVLLLAALVAAGALLLLTGPVAALTMGATPAAAQVIDKDEARALGTFDDPAPAPTDAEAAPDDSADGERESDADAPATDTTDGGELDLSDAIIGAKVSGFSTSDILGLLWRLALVVAIIWASIWTLRRFVQRGANATSTSGALKLLETIRIANNGSVQLLEAGDRVLVVGSTTNQISLLAELTDDEVISALRTDADRTSTRVATLGDMMRNVGGSVVQRVSTGLAAQRTGDQGPRTRAGGAGPRTRAGGAGPRTRAGGADPSHAAADDLTPILQQMLATQQHIAQDAARLRQPNPSTARTEAE